MIFVHTLGTAAIDAAGLRLTPSSARRFALLFRLSVDAGQRISRAALHDLIFPDQTARNANHSLRQMAYQFRKYGILIEGGAGGLRIPPEELRADYRELLAATPTADAHLAALGGGLLPGWTPTHSESYSEWLDGFRTGTSLDLARHLLAELHRARDAGAWRRVDQLAHAILGVDPLHEGATLALAETFAAAGAKTQAAALLDRYTEHVSPVRRGLEMPALKLRRRIHENFGNGQAHGAGPFVGRHAEMTTLVQCFRAACTGHAQRVLIWGESGIGKTRLASEFCTRAAFDGAYIERVHAQPQDSRRPLAAFLDLVPKLLDRPGALGCRPESMDALRQLVNIDSLSAGMTDHDVSATTRFATIKRSLHDLIDAITSEAPLLLLVENIQWLDSASLDLLDELTVDGDARRLMIVATARHVSARDLAASERCTFIALSSFTSPDAGRIIDEMLMAAQRTIPASLHEWIDRTAAGNPLFVHLLTVHYLDTGESFAVPPTLRGLLASRLAALDRTTQVVLDTCIALGKHCTVDRLTRALDLPAIELIASLRELETSHLVGATDDHVELAHWLVAESALVPGPPAAALLQRRVAEVLERDAHATHSPELLWEASEHWIAASCADRAFALLQACSRHSLDIGRPYEAVQALIRGSALHLALPTRVSALREAITIAHHASESELVLETIARLRALEPHCDLDDDDLALIELEARIHRGDASDGVRARLAAAIESATASAETRVRAATLLFLVADYQPWQADAHRAKRSLDDLLRDHAVDVLRATQAQLAFHTSFGDLDESARLANKLVELAAAHASTETAARLHRRAGAVLWRAGDVAGATRALEFAYRDATTADLPQGQLLSALYLSDFAWKTGADTTAADWFTAAEAIAQRHRELEPEPHLLAFRFSRAEIAGDADAARHWLTRFEETGPSSASTPRGQWLFTARLAYDRMAGVFAPSETEVTTLRRLTEHSSSGDQGDVAMELLWYALRDRGAREEADQRLRAYLCATRRNRNPLWIGLGRIVAGAELGETNGGAEGPFLSANVL